MRRLVVGIVERTPHACRWRAKGQALSYTDVTIAAVALSNETPLLTDNRKHFPMPELELLPLLE